MTHGVVNQSLASLRSEPFERCELVNQILFGETFSVMEEHKGWLRVQLTLDGYEGWLNSKSCKLIDEDEFNLLSLEGISSVSTNLFNAQKEGTDYPIRLCPGSTLYNFDDSKGTFTLLNSVYKAYNIPFDNDEIQENERLINHSLQFVNSPYLWGGRSPLGVDCSGLIQLVFKMIGQSIPRDASQQVLLGTTVNFINMALPADLAFFDDDEGIITHVGLILPEGKIIHSSGYVRIDLIDHQGIYCEETKKYSHKLRVIKRLIAK